MQSLSPNADYGNDSVAAMRDRVAELELRRAQFIESEQQRGLYQQLVEHSLGLMCSHDLHGVLLLVNPAAAESLGYEPGEGAGRNLRDFLVPEVQHEFDRYLDRIRSKWIDSGYMRLRAKNGSERVWLYRNVLYRDANGPPVVLGHALDVTGRMRTEQALRDSEERFRSLFEDAPVAYHEMDPAGTLRRMNRAESTLLGWSGDEMVCRHVSEFLVPDERSECIQQFTVKHLSAPGAVFVHRFLSKLGLELTCEVHESVIRDQSGKITGIRWALLDITEHLAAKEDIRQANADLERRVTERTAELSRSNEELQQFAYVVSHDLQAPLRQVASAVRRLEDPMSSREALDGVERMSSLISDLLRYALVANAPASPVQSVDMTSSLEVSLYNLASMTRESGAQVTYDALPTVLGDRLGMVQVFQNLIGNSIKYRRMEPPRIHITASKRADDWLFAVIDNGIGMADEDTTRIFGVFKRLHGREYPGTGIGLAICKKIIERNGGRIWAESQLGEGSTFNFTVPR